MSSDNQYTALGPAAIGFQTDGVNIDVGADVAGKRAGVKGSSDEGPGVIGASTIMGVVGTGSLRGVYGQAQSRFNAPENTTGVLAEGYQNAFGAIGLSYQSDERTALGHGPGVLGASNADSQPDPDVPSKRLGAGVVGWSLKSVPHLIDTNEPLPLPDMTHRPNGEGTGVWGASGGGIGIHGESESGRGGVFASRRIAQLQLVPRVNPTPVLPATGDWGDLYLVVTGSVDDGTATPSLYLCISPGDDTPGNAAFWAPFQFGVPQQGG